LHYYSIRVVRGPGALIRWFSNSNSGN